MNVKIFETDKKAAYSCIFTFIVIILIFVYPLNRHFIPTFLVSKGLFVAKMILLIYDIVMLAFIIRNTRTMSGKSIQLYDEYMIIDKFFNLKSCKIFYKDIESIYKDGNKIQINTKNEHVYGVSCLNNPTAFISEMKNKGINAGTLNDLKGKEASNFEKKVAVITVLCLLINVTADLWGKGDYNLAIMAFLMVSRPLLFFLRKGKKKSKAPEVQMSLNQNNIYKNCKDDAFVISNGAENTPTQIQTKIVERKVNRKKEAIIGFIVLLALFGIGYLCKIYEQHKNKEVGILNNGVEIVLNLNEKSKIKFNL